MPLPLPLPLPLPEGAGTGTKGSPEKRLPRMLLASLESCISAPTHSPGGQTCAHMGALGCSQQAFRCLATVTRARDLLRTQWPSRAARPPGRGRAGMGQWGLEALGWTGAPSAPWRQDLGAAPFGGISTLPVGEGPALCQTVLPSAGRGAVLKSQRCGRPAPSPTPSLSRLGSCGDRSFRSASAPCHFSLPDTPHTGCTQGSDKVCTWATAHTSGP